MYDWGLKFAVNIVEWAEKKLMNENNGCCKKSDLLAHFG